MEQVFKYILKHKKRILKIICIILIVVVLIIFAAAQYLITLDDAIYNESSPGNVPYAVRKHSEESALKTNGDPKVKDLKTKASHDGGYTLDIDLDKYTDEIIEELEKQGGRLNTYLSGGNAHEYLKKMIKAEYITQYPDLRSADMIGQEVSEEEFQGVIKFIRHKSDGTERTLEYMPLGAEDSVNGTTLYGLINQANGKGGVSDSVIQDTRAKILNYFSVDIKGNLIIANWNETINKTVTGEYETSYVPDEEEADYSETDKQNLDNVPEQVQYQYIPHIINYKSTISKYTVPFNYLWAFLVCGHDEEFVSEFTDFVLESKIEISIYDNLTGIQDRLISSHNNNEWKWTRTGKRTLVNGKVEGKEEIGKWSNAEILNTTHSYKINYTKTYSNSIVVAVTKLDIWYMKYLAEYAYHIEDTGVDREETRLEPDKLGNPNNPNEINSGTMQYTEGTWETTSTRTVSNDQKDNTQTTTRAGGRRPNSQLQFDSYGGGGGNSTTGGNNITFGNNTTDENKTTKTVIEEQERNDEVTQITGNQRVSISEYQSIQYKYTLKGDPEVIEKTDPKLKEGDEGYPNFCTMYLNSHDALRNITGSESRVESWLFEILENNDDTVNLLELTKYMLYCATGNDYGVTEFDFGALYPTTLVTGLYGGTVEEQVWFALLDEGYSKEAAAGVLGNLKQESGVRSNNMQNSYESTLGMNDDQYTEAIDNGTYTREKFINDSCGYGLAQWTSSGRKEGLYIFAQNRGTSISDASMQIEFLLGEISQSGGADGLAQFQMAKDRDGYSYDSWLNSSTPEEAAVAFCKVFERAGEEALTNRKQYAREYYDKYVNASKSDNSIGYIELTGQNKSTMTEMLNEAVRIANDDRYGYSQDRRMDEFYYDCSSLIYRLYRDYFGISVPITTAGYPNASAYNKGKAGTVELKPGDVLWRRTGDKGHVTLYIGNGNYVAAHSSKYSKPNQITVYQDSPYKYMNVYRFVGQ